MGFNGASFACVYALRRRCANCVRFCGFSTAPRAATDVGSLRLCLKNPQGRIALDPCWLYLVFSTPAHTCLRVCEKIVKLGRWRPALSYKTRAPTSPTPAHTCLRVCEKIVKPGRWRPATSRIGWLKYPPSDGQDSSRSRSFSPPLPWKAPPPHPNNPRRIRWVR